MEKLFKKNWDDVPKPEESEVLKELAKKSIIKNGG